MPVSSPPPASARFRKSPYEPRSRRGAAPEDRGTSPFGGSRPEPSTHFAARSAAVLRGAIELFTARGRRASITRTRAYVEYRNVRGEDLPRFAEAIELSACYLTRAEWFEVSPATGRVVFAFEDRAYELAELVSVVEAAEEAIGIDVESFREIAHDHPADRALQLRRSVEFLADALGAMGGFGLMISPLPTFPMSSNLVALLSMLRGSPRLRRGIEERYGVERAEFLLNLASAGMHAVAQRPMSALVDALHKLSLLSELEARANLWMRREPDLMKAPSVDRVLTEPGGDRPCPLPRGPIEEYADRAWFISLSGFALSFITTRSIQRATAALFGGLPRPARIGRDVFAAQLGRLCATRGILAMDTEVLRRLDRLDCLVLQGDLLARDKFVVASVLCDEPENAEEARLRTREMFHAEHPLEIRTDGLWRLGPWELSRASIDARLRQEARQRVGSGRLLLALERAGRVIAVVEVEILAQTGVEELITAAHEARMRVIIVEHGATSVHGFNTDDIISEAEGVRAGIRRLQRAGHGVCLVATGKSPGLTQADCTIGLIRGEEGVPWGAHLIAREDLADVRFLIRAAQSARAVSRQCVNIALGAATFGTLVSAGGLLPLTNRRVMFVINMANLVSMANGVRNSLVLGRLVLPGPRDATPWYALDAEGVERRLGSSRNGLTATEVARRRVPARAARPRITELGEAITDELFNPLAPILAAGAGLSAVTGSVTDAGLVAGVVGLNAFVGGLQRFRTEQKIREIGRGTEASVLARRDGLELRVLARDLVPGDWISIGPGDVVPADCRIIESESLEVDASSITGESLPVAKSSASSFEVTLADQSSMLHAGTAIAAGRATAIVVAVGDDTEAARGASVVKKSRAGGGVERRLRDLMDLTAPVAILAGVGVIGGGLLRGRRLEDLVNTGVSLAVASVPEGLPMLATAAQLAAAERLAARKTLVRNVRAIEALGRVDVICLDKTGTLTHGKIELGTLHDGTEEYSLTGDLAPQAAALLGASLRASNDAQMERVASDPMDDALLRAARARDLNEQAGCAGWTRQRELAFSSSRGYHATFGRAPDGGVLSVKGAPEVVLPLCKFKGGEALVAIDDDDRYRLAADAARYAAQGYRVIAVAERPMLDDEPLAPDSVTELGFAGLLVFNDPIRDSSQAAISRLDRAGVRTIMITGDHPQTAVAVATRVGLPFATRVLTGAELGRLSDEALDACIDRVGVFARVTPTQKLRVVRALGRQGHVVAMVGDGANDAPALRLADVGIVVGEHSTRAAQAAADVVLLDGQMETLIDSIAEGRAMWASVRDAVSILLGGNFGEIAFTLAAGMIDGQPPLHARQLLLVNLLTDVAPAMAIALRPPSKLTLEALAKESPDAVLGKTLTRDMATRALITALGTGGAWAIARLTGTRARARTVGLAALVGTQLGQTLRAGGASRPVVLTSVGSALLMFGIIQTPGLSHFFGCRPLGPIGWGIAVGASAAATGLGHLATEILEGEWMASAESDRGVPPLRSLLPVNVVGVSDG